MITFSMKRKAINLFNHKHAPKSVVRHNATQWLKAIQYLGPKWLLATPINKF